VHLPARRPGGARGRARRRRRRGRQAGAGAAAPQRALAGGRPQGAPTSRLRHRGGARRGHLRGRAARAGHALRRPRGRRDARHHDRRPSGERGRRGRVRQRGHRARQRGGGEIVSTTRADPITLEIIQSSLQAASDEMFAAFRKTAMSAIIYEVLDMGTGITDGEGNLASSGAGIPAFVGVLDKAVKRVIELNGTDDVRPGDIYVTNDPYYGGVTHLNDVVLAMPVFVDGELIAWTANIAHWNDVGGMVPGS